MLVELFDLQSSPDGYEWKESARWLKYEEDVEGIDSHRGRPHVSFLSFSSILRLKDLLADGVILFDPEVKDFAGLTEMVKLMLLSQDNLNASVAQSVANLLSAPRLRCGDGRPMFKRGQSYRKSGQSQGRASLRKTSAIKKPSNVTKISVGIAPEVSSGPDESRPECINICTGSFEELNKTHLIMVRLARGMYFPDVEDDVVFLRFLIVILGPSDNDLYRQIGRSMSTLMANEQFHSISLETDNRERLINELDNILSESIVLPPVEIDNKDLFTVESLRKVTVSSDNRFNRNESDSNLRCRSKVSFIPVEKIEASFEEEKRRKSSGMPVKPGLPNPFIRTKRPFGGTINDIKNRIPFYWDDIKTALNFQCFTSILFIFFANFASAIALGEVLSDKIDGWMGVSEILIAHGVCGIIWGLIAGQPLCIQAAVGPFMVFEESLYSFCKSSGVDFLAFRIWTSIWSCVMLIICALVEAPFLMKYLTKFTEEIFTGLIALIFIWEAGKFTYKEFAAHPLQDLPTYCSIYDTRNKSLQEALSEINNFTASNSSDIDFVRNETNYVHTLEDENAGLTNQPDTALLQAILVIITFAVAYSLKKLRFSIYCGRTLRKAIGDFGVPVAVVVGTFIDQVVFADVYTRHVTIKPKFDLTRPDLRGWFINPMGNGDQVMPTWAIPAAILPALLVTILFYAEVEIIEKLLAKPETGLKKPSGFHWDLIVVGALAVLCSFFGLQWMCPAAVQSLSHASSLAVMKKTAPGEAPRIDYVLEQRITCIVVGILHAAAAFCGVALVLIPVSVLFGLFLYLGVIGLVCTQFWQRIVLLFVPKKYFPHEPYCQEVITKRLHSYTFIQFFCFAVLWCINMFRSCALSFPFILMVIVLFRMLAVPRFFTEEELTLIDGKQKPIGGDSQTETKKEKTDEDFYDQTTTT